MSWVEETSVSVSSSWVTKIPQIGQLKQQTFSSQSGGWKVQDKSAGRSSV